MTKDNQRLGLNFKPTTLYDLPWVPCQFWAHTFGFCGWDQPGSGHPRRAHSRRSRISVSPPPSSRPGWKLVLGAINDKNSTVIIGQSRARDNGCTNEIYVRDLPRCTWWYRCTYTGVRGRSCQYSHSWWARWRIFCCRPSDWPWGNCIALGFFRPKVAIFRKRCALAHCQVPEPTPSNLSKTVNMKVNNFCFLEKQFWAGCQFLNFNCIKETVSFLGHISEKEKFGVKWEVVGHLLAKVKGLLAFFCCSWFSSVILC